MIYFIGDKPSKNNIDSTVAFVGTRSYKTLLDWIYKMNLSINKICLYNADDFVRLTDNNKTITIHIGPHGYYMKSNGKTYKIKQDGNYNEDYCLQILNR